MADINIKDLPANNISAGTDLFDDSESFMIELNDEHEQNIFGGMRCSWHNSSCNYSVLV